MSAHPLEFHPYLQEPLEAGCLSPHQAWRLHWELCELTLEPWTTGVFEIKQVVELFHWEPGLRFMQ